jgi:hypothetical protein
MFAYEADLRQGSTELRWQGLMPWYAPGWGAPGFAVIVPIANLELDENMGFGHPSSASASGTFKSRAALQLENLALRHQLGVLHRSMKRPRLAPADRPLWVWLWCGEAGDLL